MAKAVGYYSFVCLAAIVLVFSVGVSGEGGCSGDVEGVITRCAVYVRKGLVLAEPSGACCAAVRTVDIPCICAKISKDVELVIDMNKVFRLARFCGRPLASGTKCGSSVVP